MPGIVTLYTIRNSGSVTVVVIAAVAAQPILPLLRNHQIDFDQETLELAVNNKQGAPVALDSLLKG